MTTDPAAARYRRRRRWPMLLVMAVLLAAGVVVWFQALKPEPPVATGCNQPGPAPTTQSQTSRTRTPTTTFGGAPTTPTVSTTESTTSSRHGPTSLGEFTDKNTLANVRPANPTSLVISVFNASQQRGMAKTVSDEMRSIGFESIDEVDNDPLYPAGDLRCVGEIRYGAAGVAGARTALFLMPCAQLVVDDRVDDSVDLTIGALYEYTPTSDAVKDQLAEIKLAATPPAVIDGRTASARSVPAIPALPTAVCPG